MNKVRLIIKETYQPPIDTPASVRWHSVDIINSELASMLEAHTVGQYATYQVVGAHSVVNESEDGKGTVPSGDQSE